jgi:hypothetical protein
MNVCSRVMSRTAYPGNEGAYYTLNPGEAFAETYRVLNETQAGLPLTWPIVDPSFRPDANALEALKEDVLEPWTAAPTQRIPVRFGRGRRTWSRSLATPLDGDLTALVADGSDDVQLLGDGHMVARGAWTRGGGKSVGFTVCGQRSLVVRVTRSPGQLRATTLRLSVP